VNALFLLGIEGRAGAVSPSMIASHRSLAESLPPTITLKGGEQNALSLDKSQRTSALRKYMLASLTLAGWRKSISKADMYRLKHRGVCLQGFFEGSRNCTTAKNASYGSFRGPLRIAQVSLSKLCYLCYAEALGS
jgi:hypothetical protein